MSEQPEPENGPKGVIINTASLAAFFPSSVSPVYGATKGKSQSTLTNRR